MRNKSSVEQNKRSVICLGDVTARRMNRQLKCTAVTRAEPSVKTRRAIKGEVNRWVETEKVQHEELFFPFFFLAFSPFPEYDITQ